jgi:hypothetical protein
MDGPARRKAKARITLKVRMGELPVPDSAIRRVVGEIDNHVLFPAACVTRENWFRYKSKMFRGAGVDETNRRKANDSSLVNASPSP